MKLASLAKALRYLIKTLTIFFSPEIMNELYHSTALNNSSDLALNILK